MDSPSRTMKIYGSGGASEDKALRLTSDGPEHPAVPAIKRPTAKTEPAQAPEKPHPPGRLGVHQSGFTLPPTVSLLCYLAKTSTLAASPREPGLRSRQAPVLHNQSQLLMPWSSPVERCAQPRGAPATPTSIPTFRITKGKLRPVSPHPCSKPCNGPTALGHSPSSLALFPRLQGSGQLPGPLTSAPVSSIQNCLSPNLWTNSQQPCTLRLVPAHGKLSLPGSHAHLSFSWTHRLLPASANNHIILETSPVPFAQAHHGPPFLGLQHHTPDCGLLGGRNSICSYAPFHTELNWHMAQRTGCTGERGSRG